MLSWRASPLHYAYSQNERKYTRVLGGDSVIFLRLYNTLAEFFVG